jgi:acyl transferase domain-containing protein/3-hydroxymyristoyl/3-hydroxydecanoyl-(acyl carrier protein) dehydratase
MIDPTDRVAIVGIGGVFPGSPNPARLWANVAAGVDATSEVPPGRWLLAPEDAFDAQFGTPDRVYATRGGFVEPFRFDPEGLDLDPALVDRLDPMFHLALHAARQAWQDARTNELDRAKVGVIFGNIVLPTEKASALARETLGRTFEERALGGRGSTGRGETAATEPLNRFAAGLPAGLVAKALGLHGGAYTLDAACASSLYALRLAADELLAGRADAMITGGLSRPDPLYTQMGFSQLRALAPDGRAYPLDARASGLVVGEGAGMFVLKRLSDALRHGDRMYGIVVAVGLSNDVDGGLLAPSSEGQLRAMRAAYEEAGWDPRHVDLIECHATGTPVGDAVEFQSLKQLWGENGWAPRQCVVGSHKGNIGHCLTASGASGLTKVLFAIKEGVLPPTANFEAPGPNLDYEASPFRVLTAPETWPVRGDRPRRAVLSGFGFGGINAHALIEEWRPDQNALRAASLRSFRVDPEREADPPPIAIVGMAAHVGPFRGLRAFQERVLGGTSAKDLRPTTPGNDWGVRSSAWFREEGLEGRLSPGFHIDALEMRLERFRIPPRELEEMLPQQCLALLAAADAIADAGWDNRVRLRAGVLIGIGLDLNSTGFHVRWGLLNQAREWNESLGLGLSDDDLARWTCQLRDAAGPPLSANRTMGALGGLIASRVAREFRLGGLSFTVSSEETSGLRALEVAARLLRRGDLDQAVVGAVDLTGDPRLTMAAYRSGAIATSLLRGDGACALVLERLDDAVRDGDRVYAVIRGVGAASGPGIDAAGPDEQAVSAAVRLAMDEAGIDPEALGIVVLVGPERSATHEAMPPSPNPPPQGGSEFEQAPKSASSPPPLWGSGGWGVLRPWCHVGSIANDIGYTGAASGLAALVKTAVCLYQQILPPGSSPGSPALPHVGPRFWLHDRADGPRRAAVVGAGVDGSCLSVVLEEVPGIDPAKRGAETRTARLLPSRDGGRGSAGPSPSREDLDSDHLRPEFTGAHRVPILERLQPLGARPFALFAVEADDRPGLLSLLHSLDTLAEADPDVPIETLARNWWAARPGDAGCRLCAAAVAGTATELRDRLDIAQQRIEGGVASQPRGSDHVFFNPEPLGSGAQVALVFPGIGNQFAGVGRGLSAHWPEIFRALDAQTVRLRSQLAPAGGWDGASASDLDDHRAPILGQVSLGSIVADLLRSLGVVPNAVLGYSLGESSALFASRAWTERELMHARLDASPLFRTELAGPCEAARRAWKLDPSEPADWVAGIVPYPAEAVRAALRDISFAYLLIINTPCQCVVGGRRRAVERLVAALGGRFLALPVVSTVHCPIAREVKSEYRALHLLETTPPPGLRFYSAAWSRTYIPDRETAADAITALALDTVDFPAVVRRAYDDGVRIFIETGPGASCTRMIRAILGELPHIARAVCVVDENDLVNVLDLLAALLAERIPVDLASLYGGETRAVAHTAEALAGRTVRVPVGGPPFSIPSPPRPAKPTVPHTIPRTVTIPSDAIEAELLAAESSRASAHEAFLRVSDSLAETMANQLAFQMALIESLMAAPAQTREQKLKGTVDREPGGRGSEQSWDGEVHAEPPGGSRALIGSAGASPYQEMAPLLAASDHGRREGPNHTAPRAPAFDRAACLEFAAGSIGKVLGPEFAAIDAQPTRVRLPDEPLMLVDRILTIEGRPLSLTAGRIVTEHDVLPCAWYLDGGRIPPGIAIESGQADLFLSGYLGIDFETKGTAVYRLLDAAVTFHRGLPGPGAVIRYHIEISDFFRQGDTHLFHFQFDAEIDGEPMLSMRDGCAGFFTAEALAAGQGIVQRPLDLRPARGVTPEGWTPPVAMALESFDETQIDALRRRDFVAAFGPAFEGLGLRDPIRLPGGLMTLLHRVAHLDPAGGRFGLGLIRSELDITPGEWFLTCHFVDDRVMPGTLMYECCLHALRVFLMRMGWIGEAEHTAFEPVPGISTRLRCRGQVVESTGKAVFEVTLKELGFRPEPYAIADASMYADGKPIVAVSDISLQLTGLSREAIDRTWANWAASKVAATRQTRAPVVFTREQVLTFATGTPSAAFGERYRPFDDGRFLARLPAPPYSFIDRVVSVTAKPWAMAAGVEAVAEYDVSPDAWYFTANRQPRMPFAVLQEISLQACGWLAAYMGSALASDDGLAFRNLRGTAVAHAAVDAHLSTLSTRVAVTNVSQSAGMIIQHYDFETRSEAGPVYSGETYFGFFRRDALADQVGIREAEPYRPTPEELSRAPRFDYPPIAPFPDNRLRMIDRIEAFIADGGPHGLGCIIGTTRVDPGAWFFKAHFHQDPVWPGSLGLESFLQLLKVWAIERWGHGAEAVVFESVGLGDTHRWLYRGQVVPTDQLVTTRAVVTAIDDERRWLKAEGYLEVDGRVIYQMNDFTLKIL